MLVVLDLDASFPTLGSEECLVFDARFFLLEPFHLLRTSCSS